jgi:hypothetical protein
LVERLAGVEVDWDEASGQAELLDVGSPYQQLPDAAIDRITGWIDRTTARSPVPVVTPASVRSAVVGHDDEGRAIVESTTFLGPLGLFGMVTEVSEASAGPTVLLLSVANEHHIGPDRLWVDFSRQWAAAGMRAIRFDLSGLGDSPARPGQDEFVPRAPEAFDDIEDVCRAVSPADPSSVVFVGLCSAAYQALESALSIHPRGVLAINPVLSFQPPEMLAGGPVDPRRRVALPRRGVYHAFSDQGPLSSLRRRFPTLFWRLRSLVTRRRRPAKWIKQLTDSGVDLVLICGENEMRPIRTGVSHRTLAELRRTGRFRLEFIPGLDHGLLVDAHRTQVGRILTEHLHASLGLDRPPLQLPSDESAELGAS